MLRYFFILLLFMILSFSAQSQEFNAGFYGGITTSQITGDNLSGFNKLGLNAGAFVNRYFNQRFGVQMELSYIQKGSRKNPDYDNNDYSSYLLRLNYIQIPLLFKYEYNKNFSFELGPSLGYLINFLEDVNEGNPHISKEFSDTEVSLIAGFYYQFVRNSKFSVRYSVSLFPVRKHASDQEFRSNKGQYNHVITLTFHKQFSFNR